MFIVFQNSVCFCLAPIYLLNSNQKITAFVGDTVAMEVASLGLGQHTYQWTRRGRNKHIKTDATGLDTTRLILPNVSMDDNGRYFFSASSQWSSNQTRVDLRVTCELQAVDDNLGI